MVFELISWIYISLICLIWGNFLIWICFRGRLNIPEIDFPVLCFIGMLIIGVIAFYVSIFVPLTFWIKLLLQIPAGLYFLKSANRISFSNQLKSYFIKLSHSDLFLLTAGIVMVLFLSTSPIIHPDSLNYHIDSIRIFNKYGTLPGIANLKVEFGLQSLWFAAMSVFDLSLSQPAVSYPLSGCVACWFFVFLVSKSIGSKEKSGYPKSDVRVVWYLLLLLFSILSWTQIWLTASSASPDFIVAICLWLSFYFFIR